VVPARSHAAPWVHGGDALLADMPDAVERRGLERSASGRLLQSGGAALGSLIGIVFAGPLPETTSGLIGATVAPMMERWPEACADEFRRRGEVVARGPSAASGLAQDEVVERVL
jgi:hypothetical protein